MPNTTDILVAKMVLPKEFQYIINPKTLLLYFAFFCSPIKRPNLRVNLLKWFSVECRKTKTNNETFGCRGPRDAK